MSHFNVTWCWNNKDIKNVLRLVGGCKTPLFHICSGSSNIGDVRLDMSTIKKIDTDGCKRYRDIYRGNPNILGDMNKLPFKSGVAGSVICDPPYDYDFTKPELLLELIRITKPKGDIIFIAPWIPRNKLIQLKSHELWAVGKNNPYHKIMSWFYKSNAQLDDYFGCAEPTEPR